MAGQVNPDLQKERNTATFEPDHLTFVLDGGEQVTKRKRYMVNLALQENDFANELDYYFMSRDEKYTEGLKRAAAYIRNIDKLNLTDKRDIDNYKIMTQPAMATGLAVHEGMFMPTLENQSTDEQKARWLPLIKNREMFGTYAQTELGHGTHVRGLETTSTYDPRTEEFVINSPTLTSLKWWPGGLGKTSNYIVCMAQLYTLGECYGMHAFLVQLRDRDTHEPLPGITVGDIGPKIGFNAIDNGFLKFDHFRIPRGNMLMRNAEVQADGSYVQKGSPLLTYGIMLGERVNMLKYFSVLGLSSAVTIATRYSAVRRQSELTPGAPEAQVLDYQMQQYKLFPLIATAYAYWATSRRLAEMYEEISSQILEKGNIEGLPELHATSSGLKAFTTYGMMFGIEQCRLACGGHGYSHASGLPRRYAFSIPGVTVEGENSVMYLQCSRYLMKAIQQASTGQKLSASVAYLSDKNFDKCLIGPDCSLDTLVAAYKNRASRKISKAWRRMEQLINSGKSRYDASNLSGVALTTAAEAHCHLYTVQSFVDAVQGVQTSGPVRAVLKQLCTLYALYGICQNAADFLEDGFMTGEQLSFIEQKMQDMLGEIRPNAVALVDAFDYKDQQLCSILGRYDGQVYRNMFEWAKKSPLNKTEVHDSYYKYIQPLKQSHL